MSFKFPSDCTKLTLLKYKSIIHEISSLLLTIQFTLCNGRTVKQYTYLQTISDIVNSKTQTQVYYSYIRVGKFNGINTNKKEVFRKVAY